MPFISKKVATIPAGQTIERRWSGEQFHVRSSTGNFKVAFNSNDDFNDVEPGDGLKVRFNNVALKNEGDEDIKIEVTVASGEVVVSDNRKMQVAKTVPLHGPTELQADETLTFQGRRNSGGVTRRKHFIVTNLSEDTNVEVLNAGSNIVATVLPQMALILETDANLKLKNPTANPISINLCEIFYIS